MLAFGIPRTIEVLKLDYCRKCPIQVNKRLEVVEFCDEEEIVEPFPVAERFYGEDLYIFYVAQIHEQYYPDVDPYIALAVIEVESRYQPDVQSSVGAVGLMQLLPQYHLKRADKYGLNDIWDPYTNIICGMDFLNDLIHTYGTWDRALFGYNRSSAYVRSVLKTSERLKGGGYFE